MPASAVRVGVQAVGSALRFVSCLSGMVEPTGSMEVQTTTMTLEYDLAQIAKQDKWLAQWESEHKDFTPYDRALAWEEAREKFPLGREYKDK